MDPSVVVLIVVIGIPLLIAIWVMVTYNGLVRLRNFCDEAWADIETELKRRYDLIPNLVNTVKGYATHEKDVFERVIQARNTAAANHGSPVSQAKDENV
ncbi:MAG: LemA family protein, partial [Thermoguttaceae bacterium]